MKRTFFLSAFLFCTLYVFSFSNNEKPWHFKKVIITPILLSSLDTVKKADTVKKKEKKVAFMPMPTLTYDRSQGAGVGVIAMALFKADNSKKVPLSRIMGVGNYATNDSYYLMFGTRLYLKEDYWRITAAAGYINYNFQAFMDFENGDMGGATGVYETPYTTKGALYVFALQRRIFENFYLGVGGFMMRSDVTIKLPDNTEVVDPNDTNSLSIPISYDTRNSVYNPSSGLFIDARFSTVPSWLDNDNDFIKTMLYVNYYKGISDHKILASRFAMKANFGDVPFASQDYIGQTDLRGYTQGEYRGNQTYTAQTEFRNNFYKKWGYVGFVGLGIAYRKSEEGAAAGDWYNSGASWSKPLPSIGAGARYQVIEKAGQKVNAGIDVAVGRGDWGFYFRLTEAF
ncbi:BamA/TamA family outer membrane protein [Flavobacterium aquidurense]|uniref:BamA/TamA family outer membrane protein n=1 Tax=Flavobacterium aquidurense TaxID=362413 RepID=UPI0028544DFD|nr:BamA/TamA family outer membrane protein [Flavobacterium aquidurense]MDR7372864.1 outer membrane protein assembly factor BamA [Flavobacterium aquidurense]